MSTLKNVRIKETEAQQIILWLRENKIRMKKPMTGTELVHHFIYLGLCKVKLDDDGNLYCS
jgi:hypothetical protein